jgi:hypothetical protein
MSLDNVKANEVEPEFGLALAFLAMHMNRLISLIGVEEKTPSQNEEYRWHPLNKALGQKTVKRWR